MEHREGTRYDSYVLNCDAPALYWAKIEDMQDRVLATNGYNDKKQLEIQLNEISKNGKIIKL